MRKKGTKLGPRFYEKEGEQETGYAKYQSERRVICRSKKKGEKKKEMYV